MEIRTKQLHNAERDLHQNHENQNKLSYKNEIRRIIAFTFSISEISCEALHKNFLLQPAVYHFSPIAYFEYLHSNIKQSIPKKINQNLKRDSKLIG